MSRACEKHLKDVCSLHDECESLKTVSSSKNWLSHYQKAFLPLFSQRWVFKWSVLPDGYWSHQTYHRIVELVGLEGISKITFQTPAVGVETPPCFQQMLNTAPSSPFHSICSLRTNRRQQEWVHKTDELAAVKGLSAKQMQRSFPATGNKAETVFKNVISMHFHDPGFQWRKTGFSWIALNKNKRANSA